MPPLQHDEEVQVQPERREEEGREGVRKGGGRRKGGGGSEEGEREEGRKGGIQMPFFKPQELQLAVKTDTSSYKM